MKKFNLEVPANTPSHNKTLDEFQMSFVLMNMIRLLGCNITIFQARTLIRNNLPDKTRNIINQCEHLAELAKAYASLNTRNIPLSVAEKVMNG